MPKFRIDLTESTFRRDLEAARKRHPTIVEDLTELFEALENDHTLGDWIPGLKAEVRKVRVGVRKQNIGKRGGYRLIYLVDREAQIIKPLFCHFKAQLAVVPNETILKLLKTIAETQPPPVRPEQTN